MKPLTRHNISPTAKKIADAVAPVVTTQVKAMQPEVEAGAENMIERLLVHKAFPIGVSLIPWGLGVGANATLNHYASKPVSELIEDMVNHTKASGGQLHTSYLPYETREDS